ncbi:MAG: flagellar hook-associated protein FlgL [Gammaproteobacteria bacterium]|nr:flagellar hook-associated protein FlgL [Gammaproteobacteria bacterium]MDH5213546.1 flagellar hook-associated protein FlgL [Gammaproteobacteria bacterium]
MRVSTFGSYQQGLSMMQQLQAALDHTQRQISTGRRILVPSEDPIAASRALDLREALARLGQFDRNSNIARNRLSDEEVALGSVNNVLQRVRELALQANNATQSDETRSLIAIEMRQQLDQLVQLANQQDGNGRYLFSGNLDGTTPVTRSGQNFMYNGDQGVRLIEIGENRRIPDGNSGAEVFFRIRNGNGIFSTTPGPVNSGSVVAGAGSLIDPTLYDQDTYTLRFIDPQNYEVLDSSLAVVSSGTYQSGNSVAFRGIEFSMNGQPAAGDEFVVAPSRFQDVFSTIRQLADTVDAPVNGDASRAALNNGVNGSILGLDQALGKILDVRTQVGSRLSAIESQGDSNSAFALTVQDTLAQLEDLDYAEALSRLSLQMTTLEAAQQSFIRTQQLSLFNYF